VVFTSLRSKTSANEVVCCWLGARAEDRITLLLNLASGSVPDAISEADGTKYPRLFHAVEPSPILTLPVSVSTTNSPAGMTGLLAARMAAVPRLCCRVFMLRTRSRWQRTAPGRNLWMRM